MVEVVEEGINMTAVIAGTSAAAVVLLVLIGIILHYIRGLKKKVKKLSGSISQSSSKTNYRMRQFLSKRSFSRRGHSHSNHSSKRVPLISRVWTRFSWRLLGLRACKT